jgi:hypothetical protein
MPAQDSLVSGELRLIHLRHKEVRVTRCVDVHTRVRIQYTWGREAC